jgi:hypothetical protein
MRILLLTALFFAFSVGDADARKRRYHRPGNAVDIPYSAFGAVPDQRRMRGRIPLAFIPAGWQLQPPDPQWDGKRYISPDGQSWFAAYKLPADRTSSDHMKALAFGDDETLTYIQGERSWIAASGFKGSRIFYRQAILACGGTAWHHIAFEYPAELKQTMDRSIVTAGRVLRATQHHCDAPSAERQR